MIVGWVVLMVLGCAGALFSPGDVAETYANTPLTKSAELREQWCAADRDAVPLEVFAKKVAELGSGPAPKAHAVVRVEKRPGGALVVLAPGERGEETRQVWLNEEGMTWCVRDAMGLHVRVALDLFEATKEIEGWNFDEALAHLEDAERLVAEFPEEFGEVEGLRRQVSAALTMFKMLKSRWIGGRWLEYRNPDGSVSAVLAALPREGAPPGEPAQVLMLRCGSAGQYEVFVDLQRPVEHSRGGVVAAGYRFSGADLTPFVGMVTQDRNGVVIPGGEDFARKLLAEEGGRLAVVMATRGGEVNVSLFDLAHASTAVKVTMKACM